MIGSYAGTSGRLFRERLPGAGVAIQGGASARRGEGAARRKEKSTGGAATGTEQNSLTTVVGSRLASHRMISRLRR